MWVQIAAALASVGAVALIAYDLLWKSRPRLRVRMKRFHNSDDLELVVLNRGGGPLTVLGVTLQVVEDGQFMKISPATKRGTQIAPFTVVGGGGHHLQLEVPYKLSGSFWIEAFPTGDVWFGYPPPGWSGQRLPWWERAYRKLRRWPNVVKGSSRELKGQRRPPSLERPTRLR
jgi:hypothetical protein